MQLTIYSLNIDVVKATGALWGLLLGVGEWTTTSLLSITLIVIRNFDQVTTIPVVCWVLRIRTRDQ